MSLRLPPTEIGSVVALPERCQAPFRGEKRARHAPPNEYEACGCAMGGDARHLFAAIREPGTHPAFSAGSVVAGAG